MNALAPYKVFEKLEQYLNEGDIYRIELTRFEVPNDVMELHLVGNKGVPVKTKLVIDPPKRGEFFKELKNSILQRIRGSTNGNNNTADIIREIRDLVEVKVASEKSHNDAQYRDLKLRLRLPHNREKTVTISKDLIKIRPIYDITNSVTIDSSTGHPSFESLQREAHDFLEGFKSLLGYL